MIFAEFGVTNTTVIVTVGVFATVAFAAHGFEGIMKVVDRFKDKPPIHEEMSRIRSWIESTFAKKADLDHAKELFATTLVNQDTRITQIRVEVSAVTELIRSNEARNEEREARNEQRAVDLHNRINPLLEVIGMMKERSMRHSQVLHAAPRDGRVG
jgi:hypothetical protein